MAHLKTMYVSLKMEDGEVLKERSDTPLGQQLVNIQPGQSVKYQDGSRHFVTEVKFEFEDEDDTAAAE